jgi:hypothetical protein
MRVAPVPVLRIPAVQGPERQGEAPPIQQEEFICPRIKTNGWWQTDPGRVGNQPPTRNDFT